MNVKGKSIVLDLVIYHLVGIDVILKMDWLSKNHIIVDCTKKNVYHSLERENEENGLLCHGKEHAFHPNKNSFAKATKYLHKRCQGFLASVV